MRSSCSTRASTRLLGVLVVAGALLWGGAAGATPLTYNVTPDSSLSADVVGTLAVTVNTSAGSFDGSGSVSGTLNSTPTGTITADWGAPNWANSLDLSDLSIDNPNPGSVTGNVGISVGILGTLNFDLQIDVDNITLGLDSAVSAGLTPSETSPGDGPWTAIFPSVPIMLGATASGSADGLVDINIAPFSFGSDDPVIIPIVGSLARILDGGGNDVGSELQVPIPGVDFSVPTGDPVSQPAPGCEGPTVFGACTFNVHDVELQITSLEFQNVTGSIIAENFSEVIPVPEPMTALLLGSGLAGLVLVNRRIRS